MKLWGEERSRVELRKRIGSLRQLGGTKHYELGEGRARGVRAIDVQTGSGLDFTVLPDRGLDIAWCSYKGANLVYLTPSGVVHPSYYDPAGAEWLHTFFGGLLTTCGLSYFGEPAWDGQTELGLHGRYAGLPAVQVCDLSRWEGEEYLIEITGVVEEASLFGEKLRLSRSIRSSLGWSRLIVRDTVENYGPRTSPFTFLYHVNAGYPLLDAATELLLSSTEVEPYDQESEDHLDEIHRFQEPRVGFANQDYLHTMTADEEGYAWAAMVNPRLNVAGTKGGPGAGLGLALRFRSDTLPYLNEWKMLNEVDYVVGFEPANTKIVNRATLRGEGRLPVLEPGEARTMEVEFSVLEGVAAIEEFRAAVRRLTGGRPPRVRRVTPPA